jgi:citrate synthase
MSAVTYPSYSPGLEGVIAGITKISEVSSEKSSLVYYGINVQELAEHGCFEETVYLLLHGRLPTQNELKEFKELLAKEQEVPNNIYDILKSLPSEVDPMDQIRTAYSALAPFDPDYRNNDHEANLRKATRIIAKAGPMVANGYRIRQGKQIVPPDPTMGIAANFLYILNDGVKPDAFTEKVLNTSLILYAEHGYNASTFACRVTVSTLSDLYSGIVTGIGTLKGPLHGGANEEAMRMLLEVGSPESAESWLRSALAQKKKIMGFGHREYKKGDARAKYLIPVAKEVGIRKNETKWGEIADIFSKIMLEEKGLYPNVDFPASYTYYLLGIPIELYTPIFVMARVAGWSAHAIEQLDNNRLIRPTCIYEGPPPTPYTPIEARG